MMKLKYDKEADAAYISLKMPIKKGEVKKTKEFNQDIFFDFDSKGKLIGVEILNASKVLSRQALLTKH